MLPLPHIFATGVICEVPHREQHEYHAEDGKGMKHPIAATNDAPLIRRTVPCGRVKRPTEADLARYVGDYESNQVAYWDYETREECVKIHEGECTSRGDKRPQSKVSEGLVFVPCCVKSKHNVA